jgi:integrase
VPRASRVCGRPPCLAQQAQLRETGKPLDRSKLVRRFKQALARAEVHRITFHELRHTFGTRMAAAGTPMRTLQHWMGHADSKTTQIYAHYQLGDQEADAVDRAFA